MTQNQLQSDKFRVVFNYIPNVQFFARNVSVPDVSMTPLELPNINNRVYFHGNKLSYSEFSLTFRVDENLENYVELMNWIKTMSAPEEFEQFNRYKPPTADIRDKPNKYDFSTDATVYILSNVDQPNKKVLFRNIFPTSISSFELAQDNTSPADATAIFRYDYFDIE